MPSGREIHTLKPYVPPSLDAPTLQNMRAPPSPTAAMRLEAEQDSSDDEDNESKGGTTTVVGAFPGTRDEYAAGSAIGHWTGGYY